MDVISPGLVLTTSGKLDVSMALAKNLLCYIRNMIPQKLKPEDPATFCELLAFYEEIERHNNEVKKIASRLGISD